MKPKTFAYGRDVVAYASLDNPELKQHIDCHRIKSIQR